MISDFLFLTSLCVTLWVYSHHYKWPNFVPFYGWVIFHCLYVSHLHYPCICRWTSKLLPQDKDIFEPSLPLLLLNSFSLFFSKLDRPPNMCSQRAFGFAHVKIKSPPFQAPWRLLHNVTASHGVIHSHYPRSMMLLGFPPTCCCFSVAKSCPTLWDTMDCSTPGSSVLQYLLEFAQIYVHWVSDAI